MEEGLARGTVDGLPFIRVLGGTDQIGWGPALYRYTVFVERATGFNPKAFAQKVDATLADSRGWIRGGQVRFQRVARSRDANTQVILATPDTVDKLCAPLQTKGEVSCCQGTKVAINADRWEHAVPHWTGRIGTYRTMVINHEIGHRTGHNHAYCPGAGKRAPVMMQQTYGLGECRPNSWPLASEL